MPKSATLSSAVETATKCLAYGLLGVAPSAEAVEQPGLAQPGVGQRLQGAEGLAGDDEQGRGRVEARQRGRRVGRVDVADEAALQTVLAVGRERLVGHHRAEVGAADADVDHRADPLAGDAGPRAVCGPCRRTRRPARSTSCTSVTTSWPSTSRRGVRGQPERGVQHRAVLGDVDVLAGEHRVAPRRRARPRRPAPSRAASTLVVEQRLGQVDLQVARRRRSAARPGRASSANQPRRSGAKSSASSWSRAHAWVVVGSTGASPPPSSAGLTSARPRGCSSTVSSSSFHDVTNFSTPSSSRVSMTSS